MSEPDDVPPVPTVREVGPAFAFFGFGVIIGIYAIPKGLSHHQWFPIALGAGSSAGGLYMLVIGARGVRRLVRLNRRG